ncbi:D-glycerate 3-kinase [Microsporum canis CBS 113480]|uniref:D-glycerate 3-kinase n=1 Tax=Arthroderma otae (strain ATCC MYA-4605 / CBS 113480) TaxID=554155 RepID=C5FG69_ARTOC|nr:D-glycerate 3-kinase [Microsporum canis CBS 113480]EEQ29754.1 D-glycerate 3-kinase [Microsporum canis CBS 113480]
MSTAIVDDKSEHCIPFLLKLLESHKLKHGDDGNAPPFFVGLNGIQGAGKTVLVSTLRSTLSAAPYNLPTITFSLDDIYLTHADQQQLAAVHPNNPLLQHRGQPSTHDIALGSKVFDSLRRNKPTQIPSYDKSAFNGQGDRAPEDTWETVNDIRNGQSLVRVVIFEGWCVGFRPRPEAEIRAEWEDAVRRRECDSSYDGQLGDVKLEDVMAINKALEKYDAFTSDAENTHDVYYWRQQQEQTLLEVKGKGMTPDQVTKFVNGYYPSYELYTNQLRDGVFNPTDKMNDEKAWKGRQLRLIVDKQRKVKKVITI